MSWITGLADKAENILNKIDKNAATALQLPANATASNASYSINTNITAPTLLPTTFQESLMPNMKKSFSAGALSLKTTRTSPKLIQGRTGGSSTSGASVKSEDANNAEVTKNSNLEWIIKPEMTSSRRSSISAKSDAVAIEIGAVEDQAATASKSQNESAAIEFSSPAKISSDASSQQELLAFKIALAEVTGERDELKLRLQTLNRDVENASLKQRLAELEMLVHTLSDESQQAQHACEEALTANNAYVHSISELETNLAKMQQEYMEVTQKLRMQTKESDQLQQDLQEYRAKAQRTLQTKDNLIAELKSSGNSAGAASNVDNSEARLLQIEIDSMRQEQFHMRDEQHRLQQQLQTAKSEADSLNEAHAEMLNVLRANEDAQRKELRLERERNMQHESEQRVLSHELNTMRQQLSNQMAEDATRLQEKERALELLRAECAGRVGAGVANADHDMRLKTLTQALVDKQNTLEQLTADKNALRLQLEKVQDQLQQAKYQGHIQTNTKLQRNVLLLNSTDDVKAQYPLLMKETPFDNRVARRVKRAYSSLDSAGIRLGAFLRRYPLMRIFVLIYVGLLHMWVMFVLLSSTPS